MLLEEDEGRSCQRCLAAPAVVTVDALVGGPPLADAGELCGSCVVDLFGRPEGRAGPDPLRQLKGLAAEDRLREINRVRAEMHTSLADLQYHAVMALRRRRWSWAEIGRAAGVTRARAQQIGSPEIARRQRQRARATSRGRQRDRASPWASPVDPATLEAASVGEAG